ncbi:MAG: ABC transporter ATP-binding protein [Verrucomicrobia bacterium]|nr:MAG: ABC transporter ATP-binding protein [Verrucomicrobiota bacterium]PYK48598.1 MAG: ABC transporter ATP-binding protein [Verrucomicrobiota bacterium]PYL42179.1 MAG: ABC transporter ATP-binding protein [Verrucomicrobiota bacterium]
MKTVWRVFAYLKRYPWMAAGTLTCAIMSTLMVIVFPAATKWIIDDVVRANRPDKLLPLIMLAAAAFLVQHGFNALRIVLNNTFEQRVIFDLRSDLYSHIQLLPLRWFDNRATGDLMTRVIEDVNSVERVLIDGIEQGVVAILQVVIVISVMLYLNFKLALFALVPFPLLIAGALTYTLTAHRRYRSQRRASSNMNALLHDNLAGVRQIKSFVRDREEHARFNRVSDQLRHATLVVMRVWAIYSPSMSMFEAIGALLVLGFGGHAVLTGAMQIGDLVAFLMLTAFLYDPISRLHQLNQLVQAGRAAGERVFEILDEPAEPGVVAAGADRGGAQLVADFPREAVSFPHRRDIEPQRARIVGDICYENVSFSYVEGLPALRHVSFHAPPGATIALVGATGAGKSTLMNLLVRFYEFTSGEIYVDGKSVREYGLRTLREAIGVVTQESFLFNGSIRENLLMGKPDATEIELWRAVDAANARQFIERLPDGLESVVGERGVKLSVGEKQRLSIARALLKDPPILILDEATASVDTATERLIQEALERLMANRTSIVIAHRLSTIVHAEQILVLDHGRIIERGTHDDLLALDGRYARLCRQSLLETSPVRETESPAEIAASQTLEREEHLPV